MPVAAGGGFVNIDAVMVDAASARLNEIAPRRQRVSQEVVTGKPYQVLLDRAQQSQADLIVIKGDLTSDPAGIRHITSVFRKGIGSAPERILETIKGVVGAR